MPAADALDPQRKPLAAPPTWLALVPALGAEGAEPDEPGPGNENPIPGDHLPKLETVEYISKLIVLLLLLLALPWLTGKLLTSPGEVIGHPGVSVGAAASAGA
jgi:hypothetical protein